MYRATFVIGVLCLLVCRPSFGEDKKIFSGPQVGEKLPSFSARIVTGEEVGKDVDPIKRAGGKPIMLVFIHEFNEPVIHMMLTLSRYVETRKPDDLAMHVVWLTDDPGQLEQRLKRARWAPKKTSMSVFTKGPEGPGNYGLNRKIMMTVLIAKENKVAANYALLQPSVRADAVPILESLVKVIGGKAPDLAQLTRRRNTPQRTLGNLLEAMLAPGAEDEGVIAAAKKIEAVVKERREVKLFLGRRAKELIESNRFKDRNPKALEYLRKWAKEYQSREE